MNIFLEKEEYIYLKEYIVHHSLFGSSVYGCENHESDLDIMCFLNENALQNNIFENQHQLQYYCEESNIDYIFTTFKQFFNNILKGDTTINFEILVDEYFSNIDITLFIDYKLLMCYLGLAKRDSKSGELFHAKRGVEMAKLLKYCYDEKLNNKQTRKTITDLYNTFNELKENSKKLNSSDIFKEAVDLQKEIKNAPKYKVNKIGEKEQYSIWKTITDKPELNSIMQKIIESNFNVIKY